MYAGLGDGSDRVRAPRRRHRVSAGHDRRRSIPPPQAHSADRIVRLSFERLSVQAWLGRPVSAGPHSGAGSSALPRRVSRACCATRHATRHPAAFHPHSGAGAGVDLFGTAGRGHALDRPRRRCADRPRTPLRTADLAGAPPATASGAYLQTLPRSGLRREGRGDRPFLLKPPAHAVMLSIDDPSASSG
jgi:hypothetical protein